MSSAIVVPAAPTPVRLLLLVAALLSLPASASAAGACHAVSGAAMRPLVEL